VGEHLSLSIEMFDYLFLDCSLGSLTLFQIPSA
jgi:hypothetical protein